MAQVRRRGGAVQVSLSGEESSALAALAGQVATMLGDDDAGTTPTADVDPLEAMLGVSTESVDAPDDPALRRLLPDAYADDAAAAGEFRRLMDVELRRQKTDALDEVRAAVDGVGESGTKLRLAPAQAESWLQALTDIRLVVGTRLDVTEDLADPWAQVTPDDPRAPLLAAYEWLGWLQESVILALDA